MVASCAFFFNAAVCWSITILWRAEADRAVADRERLDAHAERERFLDAERHARGQAEFANRMKDEFLATVSHELRTPLNVIFGWSHILRAGAKPDDLAKGVETIERNAGAQAKIIEDLLDMSRIISGKLRLDTRARRPRRISRCRQRPPPSRSRRC